MFVEVPLAKTSKSIRSGVCRCPVSDDKSRLRNRPHGKIDVVRSRDADILEWRNERRIRRNRPWLWTTTKNFGTLRKMMHHFEGFCTSRLIWLGIASSWRAARERTATLHFWWRHRNVAARSVTNRDSEQQLLPCGDKLQAACFLVVILTEGGRRRCWPRLNPVSSISSCFSRTRSTRRNDPVSYGRGTSLASKPQRCSYTTHGIPCRPVLLKQ